MSWEKGYHVSADREMYVGACNVCAGPTWGLAWHTDEGYVTVVTCKDCYENRQQGETTDIRCEIIQHPRSGDRYAVVVSKGRIIAARGPLHDADTEAELYLDDLDGDAYDDGAWLEREIDHCSKIRYGGM